MKRNNKLLPRLQKHKIIFSIIVFHQYKKTTADRDGNKSRIQVAWRRRSKKGWKGLPHFTKNYNNGLLLYLMSIVCSQDNESQAKIPACYFVFVVVEINRFIFFLVFSRLSSRLIGGWQYVCCEYIKPTRNCFEKKPGVSLYLELEWQLVLIALPNSDRATQVNQLKKRNFSMKWNKSKKV